MTPLTNVASVLESGDRLTRAEFHRRYCQHPAIQKAELIDGVVYVAAPVRFRGHAREHSAIIGWLYVYASIHEGFGVADNGTVYLSDESEVQPDALLFRAAPGSTLRETDDGYLEGAPELAVEVAASSASYDLHDKVRAYERAGVQEYIVWRTLDQALDWFELRDGAFVRREPDAQGIIESRAFPGLRLAVSKLLAGDAAGVLAALGANQLESDSPKD